MRLYLGMSLLRLMANSMNGLPNVPSISGPTPVDPPLYEDFRQVAGLMRQLQSRTAEPNTDTARVAINYRGAWFYIDDSDSNTKFTFLLLEQLAVLLGGMVEKAGALLTLPVSSP